MNSNPINLVNKLDKAHNDPNENQNEILDIFDIRVGGDFLSNAGEVFCWLQRTIGTESARQFRPKVFDAYCTGLFHESWAKTNNSATEAMARIKGLAIEELRHGEYAYSSIFLGIDAFLKGDARKAFGLFQSSSQYPTHLRMDKIGVCSSLDPMFISTLISSGYKSKICEVNNFSIIKKARHRTPCTVAVAMDVRYLLAFSEELINSLISTSSNSGLHFHIIGSNDHAIQHMDVLFCKYPQIEERLSLSSEDLPSDLDGADKAAFFASARFLRSSQILRATNNTTIIHDADASFIIKPEDWLNTQPEAAIGLTLPTGAGTYVPWRTVGATTYVIRPCKDATSFTKKLSAAIGIHWDFTRERKWWIDQNALYSSYVTLKDSLDVRGLSSPGNLVRNIHGKPKKDMLMNADRIILQKES